MDQSYDPLILILTSSVIAAFITSLANLAISLSTRNGLKNVEVFKKRLEYLTGRFEKLGDIREKIIEFNKNAASSPAEALEALEDLDSDFAASYFQSINVNHKERVLFFEKARHGFDCDIQSSIDQILVDIGNKKQPLQDLLMEENDQVVETVEIYSAYKSALIRMEEFQSELVTFFDYQLVRLKEQIEND